MTQFKSPDSLVNTIYDALPEHIQEKFIVDKIAVVTKQIQALPENPTAEQKENAQIYTTEHMQKFFIRHYRPKITKQNIMRQLLAIRMRYNENPRDALDRVVQAVQYATNTINLLNETGTGQPMAKLTNDEIDIVLNNVLAVKNNCTAENNQGGINHLVQKRFRDSDIVFDNKVGFPPFYRFIDKLIEKIQSRRYAQDPRYHYQHYEPIPLPMWETVKETQKKLTNPSKSSDPSKHTPRWKQNRKRALSKTPSSQQPPNKRAKYNPKHKNQNQSNKIPICFRCGKRGHIAHECRSRHDINSQPLGLYDRRKLSEMPFRGDYKPPKNPKVNPSNNNSNNSNNKPWTRYPGYNNNDTSKSTAQQQPHLNALITKLHNQAHSDPHIDPEILLTIKSIQSYSTNVDNNNPFPRQS